MALELADFDQAFAHIHGVPPFPWQRRLLHTVCTQGRWPALVDLPTGSGKTACIDIALFHLAWSAGRAEVHAARRIALVVDRRLIVDAAAERADRIAAALAAADEDTALGRWASALRSLGGECPLRVIRLRGGLPQEASPLRDPVTPTVLLSTVDQIGSRLLFRGYGVSGRMQPISAGLLGLDTLILLDEAHIAQPLQQTLDGIVREQARASGWPALPAPMRWTRLTATPGKVADFQLDDDDRADPTLARRLQASKRVRLEALADRSALLTRMVQVAAAALKQSPPVGESLRLGIIVNRVDTARELYTQLKRKHAAHADLHLLTGRLRPLERDEATAALLPVVGVSPRPRPGERPVIVVATQTLEVGADLDFHQMLIESASYGAIRQRLGRLNRLGLQASAEATLIHVRKGSEDDPIYGSALAATWAFLQQHADADGVVDLGLLAAPAGGPELLPPASATPWLTPACVDLLAQTEPRPQIEPDIASLLHGYSAREADISVVWRAGVQHSAEVWDERYAAQVLDALPPTGPETLTLPAPLVRRWLSADPDQRKRFADSSDDLEGSASEDEDLRERPARQVLVRRGEGWRLSDPRRLRGGDVVVVPAEWGGYDEQGFAPNSQTPVRDRAEEARAQLGRSPATILSAARLSAWGADRALLDFYAELLDQLKQELITRGEAAQALWNALSATPPPAMPAILLTLPAPAWRVETCTLTERTIALALQARQRSAADFGDEDGALQRTVRVALDEHGLGVARYAQRFAAAVGLPAGLAGDVELAARLHDLGKADPRFQALLGNSDLSRPLAKGTADSRMDLPLGARHEAYSVAIIEAHPHWLADASDPDLVLHLVGSHHGYGRAWHPDVADVGTRISVDVDGLHIEYAGAPHLGRISSGWVARFARLQRRYGPWGLAWLEALVRLADHRRSEAELKGGSPA